MSSQIRHGSVVALAIALAGCASSGSTAATPSTPTSNRPSTEAQAATGAIPLQGLQWTGKFRPSQAISGTTSGRADVNGNIRLTAAGATLTEVSLSFTTAGGYRSSTLMNWGIAAGDCGSNTLPLLPVASFGQITVGDNRGDLDGQVPMALPTSGRYHANLYMSSGLDEGDVLSCASLQLSRKK